MIDDCKLSNIVYVVCQRRLIYFQLHCAECRPGGVHYCITIIFPYSCSLWNLCLFPLWEPWLFSFSKLTRRANFRMHWCQNLNWEIKLTTQRKDMLIQLASNLFNNQAHITYMQIVQCINNKTWMGLGPGNYVKAILQGRFLVKIDETWDRETHAFTIKFLN